ncbi:MAG: cyclic nucleotide-binding domain-containing protein [Thermodesulfobacteriota bacterium]
MENLENDIRRVIEDVELSRYRITFASGDVLFYEGDESKDLYILLSGTLEIRKGNVVVSHVHDRGALLGELSHLLNIKRTATVSAETGGSALRVPGEHIKDVFSRYPMLAMANTLVLAKRLRETTRAYHGFKEFCDMLPEAVIIFDREGRITSFNRAAQKALGRGWGELKNQSAGDLFPELSDFKAFADSLREKPDDSEREVTYTHPEKGERIFSMKHSLLRNEIGNLTGVVALLRDNTETLAIRKKYHRFRNAALVLGGFLLAAGVALFSLWGSLFPGALDLTNKQKALEAAIAQDVGLLQAQLSASARGRRALEDSLAAFIQKHGGKGSAVPYISVMVLDPEKTVSASAGPEDQKARLIPQGGSLAGIAFDDIAGSLHHPLTLYQVDPNNPTGVKSLGLAFLLKARNEHREWLVLQLDADKLDRDYKADEKTLARFKFPE